MKCKECGNEEIFYIREYYSGYSKTLYDKNGRFITDGCNNSRFDNADIQALFPWYYCAKCHSKVASIKD